MNACIWKLEFGITSFRIPNSEFQIVNFTPRRSYTIPLPSGRLLRLGERCLLMGILNVTPDSFAEPFSKLDPDLAVEAGLRLEREGADLIDVGGESTRPGAEAVSGEEEQSRVLPVIAGLAQRVTLPTSIATYKADVASAGSTR